MKDRAAETRLFEQAPIVRAVLALAIPTVISQIILVIYNMADTFFIGLAGSDAMITAVTVCMPAFMFLSAISNLFGVGGASVIARALGAARGGAGPARRRLCLLGLRGGDAGLFPGRAAAHAPLRGPAGRQRPGGARQRLPLPDLDGGAGRRGHVAERAAGPPGALGGAVGAGGLRHRPGRRAEHRAGPAVHVRAAAEGQRGAGRGHRHQPVQPDRHAVLPGADVREPGRSVLSLRPSAEARCAGASPARCWPRGCPPA